MERGNQIMKKVTLQEIADAIGVSRISVWKVFSGRNGVSEELRKKIINKAIEMNYNFPKDFVFPNDIAKSNHSFNIAVAVCNPEKSTFWISIIHEIANEMMHLHTNLIYTYLPSEVSDNYELPATLSDGSVDGIIVLNLYNKTLIKKLSKLTVPKVFMDTAYGIPFEDLNGDLVLSSGKDSVSKIVNHIISEGRSKIGFIGDINYSRTNHERFEGYLDSILQNKLPLIPEMSYTPTMYTDTYHSGLCRFLDQLDDLPDAFICCNDQIACYLWNELVSRGIKVPDEVFISGFGGYHHGPYTQNLTTVQVFIQDLGVRLANQVLYKVKNPNLRHEIIYVSSETILPASTNEI